MNGNKLYTYSETCDAVLRNWKRPGVNNPHLLIRQPEGGGVGCMEFVEELARAVYENSHTRRAFHQCFLALRYPKESGSDFETRHFFDSPGVAAEHYNHFEGVFCIDLSEWLGDINTKEFVRLMDYVAGHDEKVKYVFVVSAPDEAATKELHRRLAKVLRIKEIEMPFPRPETLASFAMGCFESEGIKTEQDAGKVLCDYIDELAAQRDFSGYETVLRMVDDIIFEIRTEPAQTPVVTRNTLLQMKSICMTSAATCETRKSIGF